MELNPIPKARISYLAKLKQKKYRLLERQVIVEGSRLIDQLNTYGIKPMEQYFSRELSPKSVLNIEVYNLTEDQFSRICDSENPPQVAALMPIPTPRIVPFRKALCLDSISDPGNMGTIFRLASAFGIDCILLYGDCCEISNPKVIRASLGAVYKVPFYPATKEHITSLSAQKIGLDMNARISLADFHPKGDSAIYILGSEAHGISEELKNMADLYIKIPMTGSMESLNVAISAGILCYSLSLTS